MAVKVPFNDLKRTHDTIKSELYNAWERVYLACSFIGGREVESFEEEFAKYNGLSGKENAAGVSNGTDGLELALRCLDINSEQEVILPANTFNATASAVRSIGAKPVLVDVNPHTKLIDLNLIKEAVTDKTGAIMPVHLYGQQCQAQEIFEIASERGIKVIEDACQAHGSARFGKSPGHYCHAAVFSFYPGKNLGALGDGGAVISNNPEVISRVKRMRDYGQTKKYYHDEQGFNRRLDGLQAAFLRAKLPHLDAWNYSRQQSAADLIRMLNGVGDLEMPSTAEGNMHAYHLFVIASEKRDSLMEALESKGVQAGIHYPIPLHLQKAFEYLGYKRGDFPVTEKSADTILSLPMFPGMLKEEIEYTADAVKGFFK